MPSRCTPVRRSPRSTPPQLSRARGLACGLLIAATHIPGVAQSLEELPGIVVTATRTPQPIANLISDVTVIDGDMISRAQSVPELLRFSGGIQSTATGGPAATSGLLIRGGNSGHTLILIEGFRVNSASLGQTTFEGLPLRHTGRIEVLRGPASGLYGADALAGVVQMLAPTAAPGLRLSGEAALGQESTRQFSAGVSGGSDELTGGLMVSRDQSRGFNATTPNNFGFNPDRDGYQRDGISAHFDAKLATGTHLRGIALQNRLQSDYDDGAFDGARVDGQTQLIGLTGAHEVDALTTVGFRIGQSTDKSDNRSSFPGTFLSRMLQYGVSGTRQLHPSARVKLLVERLEERVDSTSYDSSAADKRVTNSIGLVLVGDEGPHLLQASVRLDDSDQFGAQTNYSIAYGYRLGGGLRAGGSYATGFHAPGFNDLYFPNYGRSTIQPELTRTAELGLYWNPAPATGWQGKAVAFQSRVSDLISYAAVCPDPDPRYAFGCADNVDRARIKGLSLGISQTQPSLAGRPASGLSWYLNLDFLDPTNETTGTRLARRATRQMSAGAEYGVGAVTVGIDLLAANRRFDDAANLNQLGGYMVFNLRAAYRLTSQWQVFTTVENAGDRAYATALDYAQQGRLVMLGVRYRTP